MNPSNYIVVDWPQQILSKSAFGRTFDCNTLVFTNQGTQPVTIDTNLILNPGQGFTYECYPGEINMHPYDIVFNNDQASGCKLVVTSKVYKTVRR